MLALSAAYEDPAWAEASVQALEAKAATAEAEGGAGKSGTVEEKELSEEDAEAERLGVLLSKLFIFCKRKAGTNAAINFLALQQEVRARTASPSGLPHACPTPFPLPTIYERASLSGT